MTDVEKKIYQYEGQQRAAMLFFHDMFTNEFGLIAKITFNNPCYYRKSWICYLKPIRNGKVELAFLRGNELSDGQGLLESNGRKQLRSITFQHVGEVPLKSLKEIIHESILLDETKPYESKRTVGRK